MVEQGVQAGNGSYPGQGANNNNDNEKIHRSSRFDLDFEFRLRV